MTYCIKQNGEITLWCSGLLSDETWRDGYVINGAWEFKLKGNKMADRAPSSPIPVNVREVEVLTHPKLDRFGWNDYNEALDWMSKKGQYHGKFIKSLYKLRYSHENFIARIKCAWNAYKNYGKQVTNLDDDIPF